MFNFSINYWIWIPVEAILYVLVAYFSKLNNNYKSYGAFIMLTIFSCFPLWAFIAPDSTNLLFDMLLYDSIMALVWTITLILLSKQPQFRFINYLGVSLVIIGFILMKF